MSTQAEMTIEAKVAVAYDRLNSAIKLFDPMEVFGLYSGGHDSFSATYIASLHPRFSGAVHINTGIGVEATRDHVRGTCAERSWKLREYKATENVNAKGEPDPCDWEQDCLEHGFPGPGQHWMMYSFLKERQLRRLQRDCGCKGRSKRILYVTGVRSQESVRRMGHVDPYREESQVIWANPIHDWEKTNTSDLIEFAKAKRNPVVDLIHMSGECLCGAFAKPGELSELALWPQTRPAYDRIIALQKRVMEKFPWGWEESPPKAYLEEKRGQIFMPQAKQYLCWRCNLNNP